MLETVNISTRTCKMSVFNNDLRHQQLYVVLREISRKHDRQKNYHDAPETHMSTRYCIVSGYAESK